jgi:hypothetical protein
MYSSDIISRSLERWVPFKLVDGPDGLLCRWLYVGKHPFTDPFFDETVLKCFQLPQNSGGFKVISQAEMIAEWAAGIDAVPPGAFIFHVSRCGSTLLSQVLGLSKTAISLSEVPFFDSVLRRQAGGSVISNEDLDEMLAGAVKFYGARRTRAEDRLFIKTDSWHLLFHKKIRALYPETPFAILYRNPADVLESNKRRSGMQTVQGIIEPAVFGIQDFDYTDPGDYMAAVLEQFYRCIIDISENDNNTLLLDYKDGLPAMVQQISRITKTALTKTEQSRIDARLLRDAKNPGERFTEKNTGVVDSPRLQVLTGLYHKINMIKDSRKAGMIC